VTDAVCLGCGARVDDLAPCACGRAFGDPYRAADAGPVLGRCPRCKCLLDPVELEGTPLDECGSCGGVFVEGWVLDRIVEARELRLSLALSLPVREVVLERVVRYLPCPKCAVQMNRKIFGRSSGVVVDVCKQHGMWFDAGELAAVLEFIEGGGLERVRLREEQERKERARKERLRPRESSSVPILGAPVEPRSELAAELVSTLLSWWRS
jgi:Zn-finger nucleic acid-binding protein